MGIVPFAQIFIFLRDASEVLLICWNLKIASKNICVWIRENTFHTFHKNDFTHLHKKSDKYFKLNFLKFIIDLCYASQFLIFRLYKRNFDYKLLYLILIVWYISTK